MTLYSASHWAVISVLILGAVFCWKSSFSESLLRRTGLLIILCFVVVEVYYGWPTHFSWQASIPLELCDIALLVSGLALYRRSTWLYPFVFYWGLGLSAQAFSTPTLEFAFPHPVFFTFWIAHLLIVWAAIIVIAQLDYRPSWRDLWRTVGWTLAYMACVFAVNSALGANYMFLNAKPSGPTPLDEMGEWPVYLFVASVVVIAIWAVLTLLVSRLPVRGDR